MYEHYSKVICRCWLYILCCFVDTNVHKYFLLSIGVCKIFLFITCYDNSMTFGNIQTTTVNIWDTTENKDIHGLKWFKRNVPIYGVHLER